MAFNMNTLKTIINAVQKIFKIYQETQQDAPAKASKPSAGTRRAPSTERSGSSGYPGDYRGPITFEYAPEKDGDPDPGEVVWGWVPFEEDHTQGKDRPVLIIGREGSHYLALMLTSKDRNNSHSSDSRYLDIGSGAWDKSGRPSEIKLDRIIRISENQVRREGAVVDSATFNTVKKAFQKFHGA